MLRLIEWGAGGTLVHAPVPKMKNIRLPLAALLTPVSLTMLLFAGQAGAALTLDTTFDTDGSAEVDVAPGADTVRDIVVQADGALVLAGRSRQTVSAVTIDHVALTRVNGTTGALDSAFGTGGIVTFLPGLTATNGGGGDARALVVQPANQKLVVVGTWKSSQAASSQVFVARLDTNGALDSSFGTAGVVLLTPAGVTDPVANDVALRSDGSIIVVGSGTASAASVGFVSGLTSSGAPIPGFSNAVVPNPLAAPEGSSFVLNAVVILPGDVILAAGGGGDLTLAQFTSAGASDTAFDADGIATLNVRTSTTAEGASASVDVGTALTTLGDGRILIAGRTVSSSSPSNTNRVLARLSSAGALDTTFGSGGFAPLPDQGTGEVVDGLGLRPSGDLVLVGQGFSPTQVSPNGIAVSTTAGPPTLSTLADLAILADGDVAAAGQRTVFGANTSFIAVRFNATDLADGADTVPEPFSFVAQTGLELGVSATSNTVTIAGLAQSVPISISGGDQYSIGCTVAFVSTAGTIGDGATVCVKTNASQSGSTAKTAVLTIGGVAGEFTVVTGDATPDPFTFVDQTDVAAGVAITSAPIPLTGLGVSTDVSVEGSGSAYSVGCNGTFVTSGKVANGAQICVRHTSSSLPGGTKTTTLRAGTGTVLAGTLVQDDFTTTTAGDITPDQFNFVDQPGVPKSTVIRSASVTLSGFTNDSPITVAGGEYSIGCTNIFTAAAGTVAPNATVCVRHTSSAAGGTTTNTTLTVGAGSGVTGVSDEFRSTTAGEQDTTPDAFSFVDKTNVALAAVVTSDVITLSGFDTAAPASITGGTVSVNCGGDNTYTASPQPLPPNSRVCVRHTSPVTGGTATNTVLTVGGVSDTFTSTTVPGDAAPSPFSFTDQTGVDLAATITSVAVTISGIDIASPVVVTGGQYSIGCTSTFVSAPGSISNGETVCVRHQSSFDSESTVTTTLTIGAESGTFRSTTKVGDQTPDAFSFTPQTGIALSTRVTSNTITIAGIDSPVKVVSGTATSEAGFSVGCTGDFNGQLNDIVKPGDTLCVRITSSASPETQVLVTLTIGGTAPGTQRTGEFVVTTGETIPDQFAFTDQVAVALNAIATSDPVTITGITAPSKVEIASNGQYQLNCTGSFTSADGLIENGDTICVRHRASAIPSMITSTELTIGGVRDTFTSTTTAEQSLPGGSSMGLWSLLLAPLVVYRRRRSAPTG